MRITLRLGWTLAVLGAALFFAGCGTAQTVQGNRPSLAGYALKVVESSDNRQLSPQEMEQLRLSIIQFLQSQNLPPKDSYFVQIDFSPEKAGDKPEFMIVQLVNVAAPSYTVVTTYGAPESDYFYDPYNYGYGYRSTYFPWDPYGNYYPYDSYYYYGAGNYWRPSHPTIPHMRRPDWDDHRRPRDNDRRDPRDNNRRDNNRPDPRDADRSNRPTPPAANPGGHQNQPVNHGPGDNNRPNRPTPPANPDGRPTPDVNRSGDHNHYTPPTNPGGRPDPVVNRPNQPRPTEGTPPRDSGRPNGGGSNRPNPSTPPAASPGSPGGRGSGYTPPPAPPSVRPPSPPPERPKSTEPARPVRDDSGHNKDQEKER